MDLHPPAILVGSGEVMEGPLDEGRSATLERLLLDGWMSPRPLDEDRSATLERLLDGWTSPRPLDEDRSATLERVLLDGSTSPRPYSASEGDVSECWSQRNESSRGGNWRARWQIILVFHGSWTVSIHVFMLCAGVGNASLTQDVRATFTYYRHSKLWSSVYYGDRGVVTRPLGRTQVNYVS